MPAIQSSGVSTRWRSRANAAQANATIGHRSKSRRCRKPISPDADPDGRRQPQHLPRRPHAQTHGEGRAAVTECHGGDADQFRRRVSKQCAEWLRSPNRDERLKPGNGESGADQRRCEQGNDTRRKAHVALRRIDDREGSTQRIHVTESQVDHALGGVGINARGADRIGAILEVIAQLSDDLTPTSLARDSTPCDDLLDEVFPGTQHQPLARTAFTVRVKIAQSF